MTLRDKIKPMPTVEEALPAEDKKADGKTNTFVIYDHTNGTFIVIEGEIKASAPIVSRRFEDWVYKNFDRDALWLFHTKGVTRIG